ncbi:hypothetical protein [Streptomyces sioyaensis]|uniref:hypothetical protein n=1 Tax=Streptomyces sioyaensis TaxID=67364 RepID=UPI0037BAF535
MSTPHPGPEPLYLADTPGYPLARTVEMPETVDYPTGALSIRLGALQVRAEGRPEAVAGEDATYRIPALVLTGRYALDARPDEIRDLDTAGNLRPLSEEARQPTLPAGSRIEAPHEPPDPDTLKKWRDRADAHRTKLMQTDNGRKLLTEYGANNESYYGIFDGSSSVSGTLRKTWRKDGVTRRASEHTYGTTDPSMSDGPQPKVNDWKDPERPGTTYNGHAFGQQLAVGTALALEAENIRATDPDKADQYVAAAGAATSFSKAVTESTGNKSDATNPMTQQDIYTTVDQHSGVVPTTSPEEIARYAALASGAYAVAAEDEPEDWLPLTDNQRSLIQEFGRNVYHDEAREQPQAIDTLHQGDCSARLDDVRVTLDPDRADATVTLPALTLHIDDASWQGPAGEVARERLRTMRFVQELLRDAVSETVRHAALTGIAGYAPPQDGRS